MISKKKKKKKNCLKKKTLKLLSSMATLIYSFIQVTSIAEMFFFLPPKIDKSI